MLITVLFVSISNYLFAQWTTSGSNIYYNNGNIGIGTITPVANLSFKDVSSDNGNSGLTWFSGAPLRYGMYKTTGSWTAPNYQQIAVAWDTGILLDPGANYGKSYVEVIGGGLRVTNGGVAIGTSTMPAGYKFAVNGSAITTSITVMLNANWPDYVFKPSFQLRPLTEVKAYIDKNQHLPEIPSAQEIAKDGQNLGEMNKLLLKKVEELTLYLIENERKDKEKNQLLEGMQKRITELENNTSKQKRRQK
ncbi:hypothetical protein FHW88_000449 [Mucilaginibacter sp. SG538B]|uniref:hypothetical protein n=1 Tax=Mucilaginibacter sp. SG538B TaxID=2587021 RepID=UPI00159D892F|nr:hypothetical protein [Mucilaginibacter sp. SG538B]NVM62173.1 hypothetical protein [Mucilaginibacter sp. SG538B]